jgi:hypothetical protein
MVLLGAVFNFISSLYFTKLFKREIDPYYDRRFSVDKYGVLISFEENRRTLLEEIVNKYNPIEEHVKE